MFNTEWIDNLAMKIRCKPFKKSPKKTSSSGLNNMILFTLLSEEFLKWNLPEQI